LKTTTALSHAIRSALSQTSVDKNYIQTVHSRGEISSLLELDKYIDLVIPRGSNALVSSIQRNSRIPVMGHADGLCTVFLDATANKEKAIRVVLDSKVCNISNTISYSLALYMPSQIDYPAACNAAEILLLHTDLPKEIWTSVATALLSHGVQLRCDAPSLALLASDPSVASLPTFSTHVLEANPSSDFTTEFLDTILAVHTTPSLSSAVSFINSHSSHHTDSIVTESESSASIFCRTVDSAGTFVNASTRFADGFRYGFGTEVGISTGRIHARGPVGLEGLVIYKYVLKSEGSVGHIVSEFGVGEGKRAFKHAPLSSDSIPAGFDIV
jgi:glutamate-5-semialdehyde dehydrogenase